jgi:GNAT superfamily N-acetyltransferase
MIRPATEADQEAVINLLLAQLHEHGIMIQATEIAAAVEGVFYRPERGSLFVATMQGIIIGVAYLSLTWTLEHRGKTAWLEELYVVPEHRNEGIGRGLLTAVCDHAIAQGCAAVDLEIDTAHQRGGSPVCPRGLSSPGPHALGASAEMSCRDFLIPPPLAPDVRTLN